ncbi:MAG TPA: DUF2169 domain-containing protein [Polyangiaceae bacterium]|jgi:hypothetical protein|nr:DUF2169 domain-containing protein [Polyangiaceae bacterium]
MASPRVDNDTDFIVEPHLLVDKDGERIAAIAKATFELADGPPKGVDGSFAIAPKARRRGIRAADLPWGKPEISSIRYPSDLCLEKPGTDVIVVAIAHAPGGKPLPRFDAGVRVGRVQRVVRITGPRVFAEGGESITEPRPIASLEVRYDYAFGGVDDSDPAAILEDPRNPVGRGFARRPASMGLQPAPQIEDPTDPVKNASSRPKPAGLSAIGRHWEPRRRLWGNYGGDYAEKRAPLPPLDFDPRANLAATPELVAVPHLAGGEEGALTNLTPGGGTLSFTMPRLRLAMTFAVKDRQVETIEPRLDTVLFDTIAVPKPTLGQTSAIPLVIELVWRASVRAPRKLADCTITVTEKRG